MCDCFIFLGSIKHHDNDRQTPLLIPTDNNPDNNLNTPTTSMSLLLKSWLNGHWLRYIILLLFSPLIIPIIFALSPFIFAAEICFCLCRLRRRRHRLKSSPSQPPTPPPVVAVETRQRDGVKMKVGLLDRYLDDQLELALEILDECGGDLGYCYDFIDWFDNNNTNNISSDSLC